MSRVPHKKIIQSVCHVIKKSDSACHLSENAESTGLEGILKQKKNYKDQIQFFFLQWANPKVSYITRG